MKTKIKRHSRSVISVVLAISMLISCMMVGLITTNAAYVNGKPKDLTANEAVEAADGGAVGAKSDAASVGAKAPDTAGAKAPEVVGATENTTTIYVNKDTVNGIYAWTNSGAEPLNNWDSTESNVSSNTSPTVTLDNYTGNFVKLTFPSTDSTFKYIARRGTEQTDDSSNLPIGGTYVVDKMTNTPGVIGGGDSDEKWDAIFDDRNLDTNGDKYLLKNDNDALDGFTNLSDVNAYSVDGKIYFKIPYSDINANGNTYFMLAGAKKENVKHYREDWYQYDKNNEAQGNKLNSVGVDTSSSDYLSAVIKDRWGSESGVTDYRYYYSQLNVLEDAKGTFKYVVLEINPDSSKKSFTFYTYGADVIAKKAKVVVENGSYGYQSRFGNAVISSPAGITAPQVDWYRTYRVDEGTQLYITTTVDDTYKDNMYVYAYSVNGVKYEVKDNGDGTYTNVKPINVGTEDIEVTPVYYSKAIENNKDYISVYVDATDELIAHWGNQIYVYSYYYNAEGTGSEGRMDGNYPGQTLVLDASGYYYGKIARYYYRDNYKTKDANHPVSGVTFSGGYENNAPHHNFINYAQNRQTYDYDDFKYIAELGYDTVRLDLKYTDGTQSSNQYQLLDNSYGHPATPPKQFSNVDASKVQGWEYLYDFDYAPCSVLGLSQRVAKENGGTWDSDDSKVKIISVGNQNDDNTGKWSTYWYVYKKNGNNYELVTSGLPSSFICRTGSDGKALPIDSNQQTEQWKAIVAAGLQYTAASIAYEAEMGAGNSIEKDNTGHRIDGRWIYTLSTANNFQVHAGVALLNNDGTYTFKENFNEGELKAAAYIDNAPASDKVNANVSTKTFKERNVEATLSTDTQSGDYYFEYWALVKGSYPESVTLNGILSDVNKLAAGEDPTTKITASTNQFFVAVYKQITGGKLVVQHNAYTDGGKTGLGDRYITADIVQSNGTTVVKSYNKAKGSLTLSGITNQMSDRGYQIRIKLDAVSLRDSKFNSYWLPNGNAVVSTSPAYAAEDPANAKKGAVTTENDPATYTVLIPISNVWSIINASESASSADAYTIVYKSDFDRAVIKYNLKYNYDSYIGNHVNYGSQYYVQQGEFTDNEIAEYLIWDDEFVTSDHQTGYYKFNPTTEGKFLALKSPYEKNIRRDLKWDFSDLSKIQPSYNRQNKEIAVDVSASDPLVPNVRLQFIMPYRVQTDETNGVVAQTTNGKVVELKDSDKPKDSTGNNQYSKYLNVKIPQARVYELNWQDRETNPSLAPMYVTAVESIVDKDDATKIKHFQYWSIQTVPADVTSDDYEVYAETKRRYEVARCYNLEFNFTAYQDYIIEPVYGNAVSTHEHKNSATITFTENGRNQWNVAGGKGDAKWNYGDRIFSDFMISFDRADKLMLNTVTDDSVTTGLVVETVEKIENENGVYTPKSEKEYANLYGENPSTEDVLAFINGDTYSGKYEKSTINLSSLDNKNRIEFYRGVPNIKQNASSFAAADETTRKYNVYRAYAYMKDANGVVISKPVYYTIYDIATIANGDSEASYQGKAA